MWAIIGLIKELFAAWNTWNSPEARLRRLETKAAEREGEAKLKAEQLKRKYDQIDADKKTGNDLLDSLSHHP
jgi:hypothetical protein